MSTDIVHWSNDEKKYQAGALHIYLALCIPFMVTTFAVWAILQWLERRKAEAERLSLPFRNSSPGHIAIGEQG